MRKSVTASELMERLRADPDYVKSQAEKAKRLAAQAARLRVEEASLLADLRLVGWDLNSVWDLVNTRKRYREAIPILLEHLKRPYSDRIKCGIARALAVPDASGAWPFLVEHYKTAPVDTELKDSLAAAVAGASTDDSIPELIELVKDRSLGTSRLFFLLGLKRSRTVAAKQALEELSDDPDLANEIASWRGAKTERGPDA